LNRLTIWLIIGVIILVVVVGFMIGRVLHVSERLSAAEPAVELVCGTC
jgi:hypothetical protein